MWWAIPAAISGIIIWFLVPFVIEVMAGKKKDKDGR